MNSDETGYNAMVTGTVDSIHVSKRGMEINILPENQPDSAERQPYKCRLDRSITHATAMLELAKTAMLNGLTVSLLGSGDDRYDTLEFDELRVFNQSAD